MFCDQCGKQSNPDSKFCSNCGRSFIPAAAPAASQPPPTARPMQYSAPAMAPASMKMDNHLRILGIIWILRGVLHAFGGIWLGFMGSTFLPHVINSYPRVFFGMPFGRLIGSSIAFGGFIAVAFGIIDVLTGWALLQHEQWGRTLALVVGVITLLSFPFGTALGIYTLIILLPSQSEEEYRRTARAV